MMKIEVLNKKLFEKSDLKTTLFLFVEWFIIVTVFYVSILYNKFFLYIYGGFILATRMNAFYSLIHEACHYHLFKNKKLNDWIGNLLVAWPIFGDVEEMRRPHLLHHKHLLTDNDPEQAHLNYAEFQFPMSKKKFYFILFKDLIGFNFIKYRLLKMIDGRAFKNIHFIRLSYYIIILSILYFTGYLKAWLLLWPIPYMTIFQVMTRVRLYFEHFHVPSSKKLQTRSLHLNSLLAFFLAPYGLGYHAEHHLYPGVPYYNLRKLHKHLIKKQEFAENIEIERNYLSFINKATTYGA